MKVDAFDRIARNIATWGHHVYLVGMSASPRWLYSIGLTETHGVELVLAGSALYAKDAALGIVNDITNALRRGAALDGTFALGARGTFRLGPVRDEWVTRLLLGAVDYYRDHDTAIRALQILPEARTIDVPDLGAPLDAPPNRAWRWLDEPWPHPVPESSIALVDLPVLRGARSTHVGRWETDEWEVFSTPPNEVDTNAGRAVPIDVVLASDPTLAPLLSLAVGETMVRDARTGRFRS